MFTEKQKNKHTNEVNDKQALLKIIPPSLRYAARVYKSSTRHWRSQEFVLEGQSCCGGGGS